MHEERQIIRVADGQPMRTIEVRNSAGCVDIALVVVSSVERGVARRGCVNVLGERVGGLEIALTKAPREGRLQRVINGVRIVSEKLVAAVSIQSWCRRPRNRVRKGIARDR